MKLEDVFVAKMANKTASELKSLGVTKEVLIQVGYPTEDIDILFTTVETPTFGVTTMFLKTSGVRGTERSYMLPSLKLDQKLNVILTSVIFGLSKANKALFPELVSVLKTETEIMQAVAEENIGKYNSIGCFLSEDKKTYRMGILDEVVQRTSSEYTIVCSRKADANNKYDQVDILPR